MDHKKPPHEDTATMDVLVLGLCRTGTLSMKIALEELGYKKVYHFSTVDENESHSDSWIELLMRKYEGQEQDSLKITKSDLHQLFKKYNAVTDIPAACFAPELMAAYTNAKIILTTRTATSWHKSMLRTIWALQTSRINRLLLLFADKRTRKLSHLVDLIISYYFPGDVRLNGIEVFEQHNTMIREIAMKDNREFLEFRLGDGWEKLCEFLGKPEPDQKFPRVNDTASWRKAFGLDLYFWVLSLWILLSFSFIFWLNGHKAV